MVKYATYFCPSKHKYNESTEQGENNKEENNKRKQEETHAPRLKRIKLENMSQNK